MGISPFVVRNGVDLPLQILSFLPLAEWLPSSMVEQLTLNQLVPGSSPGGATTLLFFVFAGVAQR